MTPRTVALIGGVTACAAALSVAVVLSVDWSEAALYDPARILLFGPREAFAAAQTSPKFSRVELALFLLTGASFVASGLLARLLGVISVQTADGKTSFSNWLYTSGFRDPILEHITTDERLASLAMALATVAFWWLVLWLMSLKNWSVRV